MNSGGRFFTQLIKAWISGCSASACQLLRTVFSDADLLKYSPRIAEVAKMDLIGQAVSKSVAEVQEAVMRAVLYSV